MRFFLCAALAATLGACASGPRSPDLELHQAIESAHAARTDGPTEVTISRRIVLRLYLGLSYVPAAEGGRLLRAMGQRPKQGLLGVVIANGSDSTDIAALYASPGLEVLGWNQAPELARFRQR